MPRAKMHEVPKEPVTFNIHPDVTRWLEVQAAMNNISRSQQAENALRFAIKLQNRHLHGKEEAETPSPFTPAKRTHC